ncbi:ATP-binding protein [Azotobacter sp. CWF10]
MLSHRVLFAQVLNSVIANAIEAMPRGGSLRIRLAVDALERRLRLTIGDSGNGMTKEQMAMAFKAFYTTKRGGLGVGLVLVKRIMERFGGAVRLESREREGTEVCLVFRIAEGDSRWSTAF